MIRDGRDDIQSNSFPRQGLYGIFNSVTRVGNEIFVLKYDCRREGVIFSTLSTGDADLRFYITTVQDG